jgi:hypothetical protein
MALLKIRDNSVWGYVFQKKKLRLGMVNLYDISQQLLIVGLFAPPKLFLLNAQKPLPPSPPKTKKKTRSIHKFIPKCIYQLG